MKRNSFLRILIPVTQLPVEIDSIKGGVDSALINLLNGFAQCEIEVRVVSFSTEVSQETIKSFSEHIRIHYIPEGKFKFHLLNYWLNGPKLMRKQIDEFKPDLVHFQEGNSFFLIKPKEYPLSKTLITIHGFALEEAKRKKKTVVVEGHSIRGIDSESSYVELLGAVELLACIVQERSCVVS